MNWTEVPGKAYRLFFDDLRLSAPASLWILVVWALPFGGFGRSLLLFAGIAAILLSATLTAKRRG